MIFRIWFPQVVENLNLAGVDRVFVCTALSSTTVFMSHCALRLKRSGTSVPRMELVEVGPSMDLVVRRHRLPNESLKKEAMKAAPDQPKKVKTGNVVHLKNQLKYSCKVIYYTYICAAESGFPKCHQKL